MSRRARILAAVLGALSLFAFYIGFQLLHGLGAGVWGDVVVCLILTGMLGSILWLPLVYWNREVEPEVESRADRFWINTAFASMGLLSFVLLLIFFRDVLAAGLWAGGFSTAPLYGLRGLEAILVLTGVAWFWSRAQAFDQPRLRPVVIQVSRLSSVWEGFTIAQLTDLHLNPRMDLRWLDQVVARTNALAPDWIVLTGDIGDGDPRGLSPALASLGRLQARKGVFYVPGNHEYYWDAPAWVEAFQALGFTALLNEHFVLENEGRKLVLAGVTDRVARDFPGSHRASQPCDPRLALEGAPEGEVDLRILLAHQPEVAYEAEKAGFHLQLSGHTHGGQFAPWIWVIRVFQPFVRGWHQYGSLQLYVSPGTGFWGPAMRLGSRSEITQVILKRGD